MIQVPLLVADEAYVVQLPEQSGLDHAFYDQLSPSMPVVWVLSAIREFEDPLDVADHVLTPLDAQDVRHVVGLRNRGLYLQLLESLFAHLFANAQFPLAPQAWLMKYRPSDLRKLAGHLKRQPWTVPENVPTLGLPRELVAWLFGVDQLERLDDAERGAEVDAVTQVLTLLAADYAKEGLDKEYNVAKHGIRAMPSPWSLSISPTGQPHVKATLASTHGTHFLVEERGLKPAGHYFALRRRSQSWHPERDLKLARLTSWLLHNLISARRSPGPRRYYVFREIDLTELTAPRQSIEEFEAGVPLDVPDPVPPRPQAKADALAFAEGFVAFVRDRAASVAEYRRTARSDASGPVEPGQGEGTD